MPDWPTAATIITAILGVSAPATAYFVTRNKPPAAEPNGRYAKATEFAGLSQKVDSMGQELYRRLDRIEKKLEKDE